MKDRISASAVVHFVNGPNGELHTTAHSIVQTTSNGHSRPIKSKAIKVDKFGSV